MNKVLRGCLCAAVAVAVTLGYDRLLRAFFHVDGSPLLFAPQSLAIPRWHENTVTLLVILALLLALALLATWVLSAPQAEVASAQRREIGQQVLDEALQRVKADVPLSPAVEAKAVNGFWKRFERLFG
jgi:hypothetical protein